MTNHNRVRISKLAIGLAIALAAAPAFAQNTTSALGGRILGANDQAVSGAEVTIVHTESGSVSKTTTDAEGRYIARGLRVGGPYTITTTKDGKTETREGVYLELAETGNVDIKFAETTTLAAINVTGTRTADVFDSKKMGAGTSINREKLTTFASIQRNLQDYARLDPRLSQTDKDRGEISAGGQNSRFNSITIDGVATNDTFGLEANNLPTLKQPISIDAIQSAQVNISNYDVTQKGYTGANINAVTKSGTNDFKGSIYYVYRNDTGAGDRYDRPTDTYVDPPEFTEDTKGFTFGGPLIEDKLFFFASYEELASTRDTPAFGPVGSSAASIVNITNQNITDAVNIGSTNYGLPLGSTFDGAGAELGVKDSLIKIDANLGERHRMSLRWSKTEQTEPNYVGFGSRSLSLSSYWYDQDKTVETWVGQWFADWTENFSTEFKASFRDYDSIPVTQGKLPSITLCYGTVSSTGSCNSPAPSLLSGTERSRHFNELATETWNYYLGGNLFVGDHEMKFGLDYDDNTVFNAFLQDTNGTATFSCVNSSGAFTYLNPLIAGGINCATATRAQIDAAVQENFQRGRVSSYQAQVGAPGYTIQDGAAQWDYQNLGVFFQDTWSVNDKLTLNLGLRFDQKQMNTAPIFNAAAANAPVDGVITATTRPQNGTVTRATGGFGRFNNLTLDGNSLFQPRVGFNYTFDSERPTQLRGGFGLFEGAAANVWLSNPYSNTGIATRVSGCGISGFGTCIVGAGTVVNLDPNNPTSLPGAATANVDFLSEDLNQPSVWKANLAFEHELPFWGITMSAEYIHTEVKDAIYFKHLNLGEAALQAGTDGRDMFWTPAGYNVNCWNVNGGTNTGGVAGAGNAACNTIRARALSNASYNNVVLAEHTGKGGGDNLTLSLSGAFLKEWNWSLAYAFTTAEEVSPLTSSVANSNWQSMSIFNANEEVAANSAYLVRDRFSGTLNWKHNFFGNYATRFGLVYEGRKGKPYSWIYNNDLNGDGVTNDLMYIPTAPGSGEVVFRDLGGAVGSADEEALFWAIVNQQGLDRYAGTVMKRNSQFAPWTNNFDLRISQELPGFFGGNKFSVALDILNVGNLINKKWGHIDEIGFQSQGGLARSFVNYQGLDASGRYIYGVNGFVEDLVTRQNKGESQWAAQVTVKYEF